MAVIDICQGFMAGNHDRHVERNRQCFFELPPDDKGIYVYTYYDGSDDGPLGGPLYHGLTTNARQRAVTHFKKAPWASWVENVRYRQCTTVYSARQLERRLQRQEPLCATTTLMGGRSLTTAKTGQR